MDRIFAREGEIIRLSRVVKGLSQHQVANMLGIHIRQYQRLEYGERSIGKSEHGAGSVSLQSAGDSPLFY